MSCPRNRRTSSGPETQPDSSEQPKVKPTVSLEAAKTQTDFYQILGVDEDASYTEIKKKWLKLSLIYHPDKCGGDNEKFRQINLAYKVLSNPENRKKYNDSLAKTFGQLKDEDRDISYHVNTEFLKTDPEEEISTFDRDKFLSVFERVRAHDEDLQEITPISEQEAIEMPKVNNRNLEDLMAQRDMELSSFQNVQKTDLTTNFDPRGKLDQFNFVFDQYKKINQGRTDLEEIIQTQSSASFPLDQGNSEDSFASFQQPVYDQHNPMTSVDLISQLTHTFQENPEPEPINPEQPTLSPAERLAARFEEIKAEREAMNQQMEENLFTYDNKLDDSDKLFQDKEDSEPNQEIKEKQD